MIARDLPATRALAWFVLAVLCMVGVAWRLDGSGLTAGVVNGLLLGGMMLGSRRSGYLSRCAEEAPR